MLLVNFLPWRRRRLRQRARNWLGILLLHLLSTALLFAGIYALWHRQSSGLQRELAGLSVQRQQWVARYQQTRRIWETLQHSQARHEVDAAGKRHNQRYLSLLEQLSFMMPQRLWLTEIADRGAYLSIAGMSENYTDIANLNRSLERHPALARVRMLSALRQHDGRSLLRFTLQADWQTSAPEGAGAAHD